MKTGHDNFVHVKGARQNNLKNISVGVSGPGKSSLAFGTLYAEGQRRYLESVSPYARRLFNQMQVPEVCPLGPGHRTRPKENKEGDVARRSHEGIIARSTGTVCGEEDEFCGR